MSKSENIDFTELDLNKINEQMANNPTGLDEIQKALAEINKLNNQEEEKQKIIEEKSEEAEEKTETVDQTFEENTPNEEEEVEATNEEKPTSKKETVLWKEKRKKHAIMHALKEEQERNAKLTEMLNEALNSGTFHFSKNAYAELEKAKENKKRAIEEGNIDALLEADLAFNKASNVIYDLEKWSSSDAQNKATLPKVNNNIPNVNENNYNINNNNHIQQEIISDWLDDHSYLQPKSKDYNPVLANQVADFINYLDADMAKNNQQHEYFSENYFNAIERHIDKIKTMTPKNTKKAESDVHVGSVRNSYNGTTNTRAKSPTQIILTAEEKMMCANAGVTEKEWLKYKIEQLKNE